MPTRALAITALLAALAFSPAAAQERVPDSLESLKPHEVVEAFTAEAKTVTLTLDQLRRLDPLHLTVRDERHPWTGGPGNKAHEMLRMKPIISQELAYTDAMAILTPDQRKDGVKRFDDPACVPNVPSLAATVPASLESIKPHEIVMEPMISKRRTYHDALSILTADQQQRAQQTFRANGYEPPVKEPSKE